MMPPWMSAVVAFVLFLVACLWMVAAKKRRLIGMTWQQIYLVMWALGGCLIGLGLFSALGERVETLIFLMSLFCLTGASILAGHFLAESRQLNYDAWGKHFLPFLEPKVGKAHRKLHHR